MFLLLLFITFVSLKRDYFLSPSGDDVHGDGSITSPFKTVQKMHDFIRAIQPRTEQLVINFRAGEYSLTKPVHFDSQDSGTPNARIIWQNYGTEKVLVHSSSEITKEKINKVTNNTILMHLDESVRNSVCFVDLTGYDIGEIGTDTPNSLELYSTALGRYEFARIPSLSAGYSTTTKFVKDTNATWLISNEIGAVFQKWIDTQRSYPIAKMFEDVRIHGYFTFNWVDEHQILKSFSSERIVVDNKLKYPTRMDDSRFYVYNIIDAITEPGEYFIDRNTKLMYFLPKDVNETFFVTTYEGPVFSMDQTSWISFNGIQFKHARGSLFEIKNAKNLEIVNCEFAEAPGSAIYLTDSSNVLIHNNHFSNLGRNGVISRGGDRKSLTHSDTTIDSNIFDTLSLWKRTYTAFVDVVGVGFDVTRNKFVNAPHEAIQFNGNFINISHNSITRATFECGDCGSIYSGRDWTYNAYIGHNTIISTRTSARGDDTSAIYIDDEASNMIIEYNEIHMCGRGIMIGGGRWNKVRNNVIFDADKEAIHFDWRGENWQHDMCVPTGDGTLVTRYKDMPVTEKPWKDTFPQLIGLLDDQPCTPKYNEFTKNQWCRCKEFLSVDESEVTKRKGIVEGNFYKC